MASKRMEIRISLPQPAILEKTLHAITKWKPRRHRTARTNPDKISSSASQPPVHSNASRLPTEIYEQILGAVGYDILLVPDQVNRLKFPENFREYYNEYFDFVDFKVRARNQTLRNCRLVSSVWNDIATKLLNTYLVIRNSGWKNHAIWRNESFRRQVRHVWVTSPFRLHTLHTEDPWQGLFAMIFTGFPNLETLYASFPDCYDYIFSEQILRLHVPPNLRVLGIIGDVLSESFAHRQMQFQVLRLFPKLETLIEVGTVNEVVIQNGNVQSMSYSSVKMSFAPSIAGEGTYFSRIQSLSLTGGHLVHDDMIVALAAMCPPIRSLYICGFDKSFTMRGFHLFTRHSLMVGLELLLEKVGPGLESLQLAIRQSEQLWGNGTHHLCHILARTCNNVKSLHIGEEDSFNRCIRSTSCCRELFDLAKWENLLDCQLCVYPGRGGCLDQSEGSLDALVESARRVALRNSKQHGTIIRIKGALTLRI